MLTGFPIQSLADAPAMVEFSRFPASLATAAEVYANLETAVRAAAEGDRSAIFATYQKQMERVDRSANHQLTALRRALGFVDKIQPNVDQKHWPPSPITSQTKGGVQ